MIKTPLELNHVWPENYSANSAQKVWARELRGAPPERRGARSLELQVRPRRADLRHHRLASCRRAKTPVRRAARHRRQQAGRLDQDPRQDLRALAEACTKSGSRTSARKKRELDAAHRREAARAARAQADAARRDEAAAIPTLERADRRARARRSRAYEAPRRRRPSCRRASCSSARRRADGTVRSPPKPHRRRPSAAE